MRCRSSVFLFLAGCTGDGLAVGAPWLVVPPYLAFDDAEVGVPNLFAIPIENSGTAEAGITVTAEAPFSVPSDRLDVEAGAAVELAVFATPADYAPLLGHVTLAVGDERIDVDITVQIDRDRDDDGHNAVEAGRRCPFSPQ